MTDAFFFFLNLSVEKVNDCPNHFGLRNTFLENLSEIFFFYITFYISHKSYIKTLFKKLIYDCNPLFFCQDGIEINK